MHIQKREFICFIQLIILPLPVISDKQQAASCHSPLRSQVCRRIWKRHSFSVARPPKESVSCSLLSMRGRSFSSGVSFSIMTVTPHPIDLDRQMERIICFITFQLFRRGSPRPSAIQAHSAYAASPAVCVEAYTKGKDDWFSVPVRYWYTANTR